MLKQEKANFRKEAENRISALSAESKIQQSRIVYEKLINLPSFKRSTRISIFLSLDNEIDTEPIVRKIFEENKECFVPTYGKHGMEMVKLYSMDDWLKLPVTSWGIKQPSIKDKRENALDSGGLDFIVTPGVAFTSDGYRLGHGAGYYDTYLTKVKKAYPSVAVVAVSFKEQIFPKVPTDETDMKVDTVLYANADN